MIISVNDLKNYGLYDTLPDELKTLDDKQNFAFYYEVDEENIKLKIYDYKVVKEVNVRLYQFANEVGMRENLNAPPAVGVFKNKFETRDGLFYQFLRTYNPKEKVYELIDFAITQDKISDINVSTDSVNEINTSEDLKRTLAYFCPPRIQPVMQVFDMVNMAFQRRLSVPLYGVRLKKIVNLIKYDGGVLPEMGGELRFMVIGENADLKPEQKENLNRAKALLRSLEDIEKIYLHTGWVLSSLDGKWRTNIADDLAKISPDHLIDHAGRKLYVPTNHSVDQIMNLLVNPSKIYALNYGGKLREVLDHPTLFEYYPLLGTIPIFYFYGERTLFDQNGNPIEEYYFANNQRGGYIIINGSTISGSSLSILLHETQHAIQNIEGFATGGNQLFARFVASVGSAKVRKIFACINKMATFLKLKMFTDDDLRELRAVIKDQIASSETARQLKKNILDETATFEDYRSNYKNIAFYLTLFVAENGDYYDNEVVELLNSKIGSIVYELFDNVSAGYESANRVAEDLRKQSGYREDDIRKILFQSYQNLYGEIESRSVQSSRLVESQYKNYFFLTRWEMGPIQQLVVIDGADTIIDTQKIQAAVEKKDDQYVIHLQKDFSCVPILHELGHIVFDALVKLGYEDQIKAEMKKTLDRDVDEYFVYQFLAYIRETINDDSVTNDILEDKIVEKNKVISEILDDFFTDRETTDRLKYLQNLLSMV